MDYLSLLLWIFIGSREISGTFGDLSSIRDEDLTPDQIQACEPYNSCIGVLGNFSQVYFKIYSELEEAEAACREAETAYQCILSAPEYCNRPSLKAKLSPVIKGSSRLLKDFCGFESKSKPCCALRNAYLEHSFCYLTYTVRLKPCYDKYRESLDQILTIPDELEQKKQRFCSVKWFGNCVKSTTEKYCGKAAAKVLKSYALKARKPAKRYLMENEDCGEVPYGIKIEETPDACETFRFEWCRVDKYVDHVELLEYSGTTDEEIFVALCEAIRQSLGCLDSGFQSCTFRRGSKKVEKMEMDEFGREACYMERGGLERYRGTLDCLLSSVLQSISNCQPDFDSTKDIITGANPFIRYNDFYCRLLQDLEACWIKTVGSSFCGKVGRQIMGDIIEMATEKIHRKFKCKFYNPNQICKLNNFFYDKPLLNKLCI